MIDMLAVIYGSRRTRLELEIAAEPVEALLPRAERAIVERRPFGLALRQARPPALVAEVKRASPSAGLIATDFDPAVIARSYQRAGADAISVLTEEDHFRGQLRYLELVRAATDLPLLRKDFLTTPYEVTQSAAYGADAILAIVAGLTDDQLAAFLAEARRWQLEVLVEVHSELELQRALAVGSTLLGINNRDLRTLRTDPGVTESLFPLVPPSVQVVSESGFETPTQVASLFRSGVPAFLVGEALMRSPDRAAWVGAVKAAPPGGAEP